MKIISLFLMLFFITPIANATEQIGDILDLDGAEFEIKEDPLETYPEYEKILKNLDLPKDEFCSASWRGYQGFWGISENKLWLMFVNTKPCEDCEDKAVYLSPKEFLVNKSNLTFADFYTGAILADWYTGTITYRISEYTELKKDSKGRIPGRDYEAVVYRIEKGKVMSRSVKKFRIEQKFDAKKIREFELLSKIDILECLDKGGVIKSVCMDRTPYCVLQYADAGKKCNDSSECLGKCRLEDNFVQEGTITTGFCTADNDPCGCSQLIVNGKAEHAMCYD